jgi:hypothetical protein
MKTTARRRAIVAVVIVLTASGVAAADHLAVDDLLRRLVMEPKPQPYTMTADFTTRVTLNMPAGGKVVVLAAGTLLESRAASGDPRRRKATVTKLDVPVVLRPFSKALQKAVADLVEVEQGEKLAAFIPNYDIFLLEERNGSRFLLGGVRQEIVTEVIIKQNQAVYQKDTTFRRAIAKWLFSPSKRPSIVRPGPGPYALSALVEDTGLVHQVTFYHDWGVLGSRLTFVVIDGRPFWREVISDTSSEVPNFGRIDGLMVLQVSNHCLNCPPR